MRPGDWGFGVSVQQQVLPRVSVEVGYNRRWLDNFVTIDNRDQQASDFAAFSVVAPADPRLPGGGGQTITGLYNVNPNVVNRNGVTVANTSANDAYNTLSCNYGKSVVALQRRAAQRERPRPQRPDVPGRRQHRQDRCDATDCERPR